jgi:ADP-heptose:LPS heptosyltransferase
LTKKILIIRFSSIGDIVLTTPVIRAIKNQLGAEVHFLTKEAFAPILLSNPHVDKVITLSDDFGQLIETLKDERYDFIADLHHNLRTLRIKQALGRPSRSFHKLNFEKWLLVRTGINRLPEKHIVDRYMETVRPLGIMKDNAGLDFTIPEGKEVDVITTTGYKPKTYTVIVVGAAHQTKCLTTRQVATLIALLNGPLVLLGGKGEIGKAQEILAMVSDKEVFDACGKFDLYQSASVLQQAMTIIAHDTGMMHIASALQKPQVVVWGNTVPAFGMYPFYGQSGTRWISVEQTNLRCRPCSKLGYQQCPKGHFKCMLDHDLKAIAEAALSLASEAS